jgi:Immunity protein 61
MSDDYDATIKSPRVSAELLAWAQRARFASAPQDSSGAALFWTNPGGETRLSIRTSGNEMVLSSVDRGQAEVFELSSPHLEVLEKHLWDFFGSDVRARLGLPWLKVSTTEGQLPAGFRIERRTDGLAYLMRSGRQHLACARPGDVATMNLVVLSHLLGQTVDRISQTYESPDGSPIFAQHAQDANDDGRVGRSDNR